MSECTCYLFDVLEPDVLTTVLSQWITTKELSKVDVAVCNRGQGHRLRLQQVVSSGEFVTEGIPFVPHNKEDMSLSYFRWLVHRNIKVNRLGIATQIRDLHGPPDEFLNHLRVLFIRKEVQLFAKLRHLDMRGHSCANVLLLRRILRGAGNNLESVEFLFCDLHPNVWRALAEHCPAASQLSFRKYSGKNADEIVVELAENSRQRRRPAAGNRVGDGPPLTVGVGLQPLELGLQQPALAGAFPINAAFRDTYRPQSSGYCLNNLHFSEINLTNCTSLTDRSIARLAECCHESLQSLDISGCYHITDRALAAIARWFQPTYGGHLRVLRIGECKKITDAGVTELTTRCGHNLELLSVKSCIKITDNAVNSIIDNCMPALTSLDISCCIRITGDAVSKLLACHTSAGGSLKALNIDWCANVRQSVHQLTNTLFSPKQEEESSTNCSQK